MPEDDEGDEPMTESEVLDSIEGIEFRNNGSDHVEVIYQVATSGRVQPIVWTMRLHVHNHECFRA